MEKVKSTLSISKGDGMSGIGVDQSALMQNEEFAKEASNPEMSKDKNINTKDINSAGGPSFGRESKVPHHKSELLNKLDPRIGYTPDEANASAERYEEKYGKPREGVLQEKKANAGTQMMGIGSDRKNFPVLLKKPSVSVSASCCNPESCSF